MIDALTSLELFSGAGGLATGLVQAGIKHVGLVERDKHACATLQKNHTPSLVHHLDIREFDFAQIGHVDVVAGGPPCQPFSLGGKHKGNSDERDMFPYAVKAIASCLPKAFVFENVKGLLRKSFSQYFEYVILRLTYPTVVLQEREKWHEHLSRLEKIHTSGRQQDVKYNVVFSLVNAADYGVPQSRERVIIVGIRNDLGIEWTFPSKTHSLDALLWSQHVAGCYWEKHDIHRIDSDALPPQLLLRSQRLKSIYGFFPPQQLPWLTVRDAIGNLPEPDLVGEFHKEHILRDGARIYPGHTGSYIDLPAKALKAGVHGVPGGENMIRYPNGKVRYFTTFEAKKIQTFPDAYQITGSWTEAMRQIGNAVPVRLSYILSKSLVKALCS
ncbi:MAG: DNA (cytosine-5-)-methyltransferase [Chloroflexota bacterium]